MNLKSVLIAATMTLLTLPSFASSLEDVAKSTYKLYAGERGICSATVIGEKEIYTANHCVDNKNLNIRRTTYGDKFEVVKEEILYLKVLRTIKSEDVAVLGLASKDDDLKEWGKPVTIASETEANQYLKFGSKVVAVGYPKALELTITEGMFTATTQLPIPDMTEPFYKTTIPVTGGSSGGGLYMVVKGVHDRPDDYRLIGATTAGYQDVSFMSYFSLTKSLNKVIKNLITDSSKKQTSTTGAEYKAVNESETRIDLR